MQTINPTTGKKIKFYCEFSSSQIEGILEGAHRSFQIWKDLSFKERGASMKKAAGLLLKNKESYARLMAQEMGKPFLQAQAEIEKCAWVCDFYAKQAKHYLSPEIIKTDATKSFIAYEPLGVILAVMPWNFPFWQVFRCTAPTMMAGNAMVLKHASNVCGCAMAIEKIFQQAGFPKGLFRTLLVSSSKVAGIIEHPLIAAVTVTGSTQAGSSIASAAGAAIKKVVLELGGSDPYIILEDADVDVAASTCVASRLINGGQSCVSAKRFMVVESIWRKFKDKFVAGMLAQRMGPPLQEGVTLGPLARHDLRDQLHQQVQESIRKGARLVLGGKIPSGPGAFYPPTVLTNVAAGMPAYHDELFGPVACLIKVRNERQAIEVANDTSFGLGAAVFTRDRKRGQRIAATQLQAGCCFVNSFVKSDPRLPFGGIKLSGYGRELSSFGIKEFVNIKTVYVK